MPSPSPAPIGGWLWVNLLPPIPAFTPHHYSLVKSQTITGILRKIGDVCTLAFGTSVCARYKIKIAFCKKLISYYNIIYYKIPPTDTDRVESGKQKAMTLVCAINWYAYICEPDYCKRGKNQGSDSDRAIVMVMVMVTVVMVVFETNWKDHHTTKLKAETGGHGRYEDLGKFRMNERIRINFTRTRWRIRKGRRWKAGKEICYENLIDDV